MAELVVPERDETLRDDWIVIGPDRFQMLQDLDADATRRWIDVLVSGTITVTDRYDFLRGCLPTADWERFQNSIARHRLARQELSVVTDFAQGVYAGRPPKSPTGSSSGAGGRSTGSKASSRSPARGRSTRSPSKNSAT